MLYYNFSLLSEVVRVKAHVFAESLVRQILSVHRVVGYFLSDLEVGLVGCIVFENIENKMFLNSLSHAIEVERFRPASGGSLTEYFQCLLFWCGGKSKERKIRLRPVCRHFISYKLINILFRGFGFGLFQRDFMLLLFYGIITLQRDIG